MITDIVGFASMTQRSEAGALQLLEEHRGIVRSALRDFQGREVKTMGDGFLIEFGSALAATECGVEILRRHDDRNRSRTGERVDLRIGIHLGEVVPEGNDILGDAVNIASRIEPIAEPGGLLISGPVYDQVRGRLALPIQALPTPSLKHIFVPISVYRVELPWKAPPVPTVTPWTDREKETAALLEAQDRARQGHGSAVIVLGEPGTGKSRLVEEFLREEERSGGVQLLRGQALRSERAVPYALWAEPVRAYVRRARPEVLARVCGPNLPEVARLVPEVVERLGVARPTGAADGELTEDRLLEGITQFFVHLADEGPLIVYLDDVQWADPYSQRLLRRAVKAIAGHRWLLIAAARDRDPSESPGVGELWTDCRREPSCSVVTLGRLPGPEFDRLLDALLPAPGLSPELRRRFHERCDGNPWFAEALLRQQVEGGALRPSKTGWTLGPSEELKIPETVQHLLRDRLDGLDPATLQVLRAGSVVGGRIPYSLLRQVSGIPEDLLLICVERALLARILEERPAAGGEVELVFRDTLTRDVLYEGLSLVRARAYHRKVAEGLEQLPERDRREQASRLAEHFLRGDVPEKALEYSLIAAARAAELYAHPEAEHLYRMALELMDELPTPEPRRAETLGALAKELELLGRTSSAVERYEASARLWESAGEARRASSVHSWIAMLLNDVPGREAEGIRHSEKAVAQLQAEGDSAELAQAYYSLAAETLRWGANPARAEELFRKSVELAVRFGDARTEAWGTYFLALGLPLSRKSEAIGLASQLALKLAGTDNPTGPGILYNVGANLVLSGKGDVVAARRYLEQAREIARRQGVQRHDVAIALGLAELDRFTGAWEPAEEVARGVLAHEPEENLLDRVEAMFLLLRLSTARGRFEEASRLVSDLEGPRYRDLLASPEGRLPWALVRADLDHERGETERAWGTLLPAVEEMARNGPMFTNALVWSNAVYLGVVLATGRLDLAAADHWTDRLRTTATEVDEPWARGWAAAASGRVAQARAETSVAAESFERSLAEWERVGWPFETGKALLLLGEAELQASRPEKAVELLERAGGIFTQLGADRYARRVLEASHRR